MNYNKNGSLLYQGSWQIRDFDDDKSLSTGFMTGCTIMIFRDFTYKKSLMAHVPGGKIDNFFKGFLQPDSIINLILYMSAWGPDPCSIRDHYSEEIQWYSKQIRQICTLEDSIINLVNLNEWVVDSNGDIGIGKICKDYESSLQIKKGILVFKEKMQANEEVIQKIKQANEEVIQKIKYELHGLIKNTINHTSWYYNSFLHSNRKGKALKHLLNVCSNHNAKKHDLEQIFHNLIKVALVPRGENLMPRFCCSNDRIQETNSAKAILLSLKNNKYKLINKYLINIKINNIIKYSDLMKIAYIDDASFLYNKKQQIYDSAMKLGKTAPSS